MMSKNSARFPLRHTDYRSGLANILHQMDLDFKDFAFTWCKHYTLCVFTYSVPKTHTLSLSLSLSLQSPSGFKQTVFILICLKIIFNAINVRLLSWMRPKFSILTSCSDWSVINWNHHFRLAAGQVPAHTTEIKESMPALELILVVFKCLLVLCTYSS